jgi:hypothetical protein
MLFFFGRNRDYLEKKHIGDTLKIGMKAKEVGSMELEHTGCIFIFLFSSENFLALN